jgi:hypothetical protein
MKTTIKNLKTIVGGLALALGLSHCTPEQSTRRRAFTDEAVQVQSEETVRQQSVEAQRLESLLNRVEPIVLQQFSRLQENIEPNRLLQQVITPLRDVVLNVNYLMVDEHRNAKTSEGRFIMPRLVTLFNEAMIMIAGSDQPELIRSTDLLERYEAILFWDCDQDLSGSCEFIRFFRENDSVNMTRIIQMMHDRPGRSDNEQLRLIRAGFDLKNRRLDAHLRFMLLKRIAGSMVEEDQQVLSLRRRRQDADLFANLLKVNVENFSGEQRYVELLRSLNPWLLSRNVDSSSNPAMTDIIRLAAQHLLFDEQGQLTEQMTDEVFPQLLYGVGPNHEQGVEFIKANIRGEWQAPYSDYASARNKGERLPYLTELQQKIFPQIYDIIDFKLYGDESRRIIDTLLSDVSYGQDSMDEYFFLANRAFFGHFSIDDATAFWSNTGQNVDRFMQEVNKLMKVQIVNNIVLTNVRMNEFYNRNENTKLIELLRESENEASKIRKAWTQTLIRSQAIKSFVNRVVNPNALSEESAQIYAQINSSVDAMTKNIKFLVTYPNMFPLMHVMASLDMEDSIRTFWGTFTIDSVTIISLFFSGHFQPWFNFGNDGDKLDSTEIMYTYYYALVTQIFETYSTSRLVDFSHVDFFEVVVKKMMLPLELELDEDRRDFRQNMEAFRNNAQAMRVMCREERRLQRIETEELAEVKRVREEAGQHFDWYTEMVRGGVMRPRNRIRNQFAFVDIDRSLYDATNSKTDKVGHYIGQIYSSKPRRVFERMRIEFPLKEVLAGTILDVYKLANGSDQPEIEQKFTEQFQEYYRLRADYIDQYLEAESEVRDCDWVFLQRDRDIRHAMIFREAEELSRLFDQVYTVLGGLSEEEINGLTNDSPEMVRLEEIRREFNQPTQNVAFPSEYRERFGYNQLTRSRLTSFEMDTAARVLSYLDELFPGQYSVTMPADFRTASIYAEASPDLIFFDWSIEDRELAKEAFVRSGIRAFANQMEWAESATPVGDALEKGRILTNLYKLGEVSRDPEVDCKSVNMTEQQREQTCFRVKAQDLIDHYKTLIQFLNIDERDMEVLTLIGKETKYEASMYERVIKREDEHRLYNYYDLIFKRVFSDGSAQAAEETWFNGELVQYVDSVHKLNGSTFIFATPEAINDAYVNRYSKWLENYYQKNIEFLEEVLAQKNDVQDFMFRYRTDRPAHRVGTNRNDLSQNRRVSLEPLVSDLIFSKFDGLSQKMNNDTSGYFSDIMNRMRSDIDALVAEPEGDQ